MPLASHTSPPNPAELDLQYVWHPFTQMRDWLASEPIVIAEGHGAVLRDTLGREYLDANSSIWTNLHGHNHPAINASIAAQLQRIAHSSFLGLANEPASILAQMLVTAAEEGFPTASNNTIVLNKVFYSDDGSTAIEVALKLAYEYTRRKDPNRRPRFVSMSGGYHGDTVGAVSLGHVDLFHKAYSGLLFETDHVPAPYCYRCPYNQAKPERADARTYRRCHWECVQDFENLLETRKSEEKPCTAFVFEPLIQGAAGMIAQPDGWLSRVAEIARAHALLLVADEVMTGFGRTGVSSTLNASATVRLLACQKENVRPDFIALAKGLTGGYLPMAATLTTQAVFDAFLGEYSEFKTFFHGHSYTGNQLGSTAAIASLRELQSPASVQRRSALEKTFARELSSLWSCEQVGDVRQVGLVAGVELVRDWRTREAFPLETRAGIRVCEEMARRGVLTRPIGSVIVLMPPYCTTDSQLAQMVTALRESVRVLESEAQ
jgi:adenosylmethionine-8-amino-7-oxononanoate aminotransferase